MSRSYGEIAKEVGTLSGVPVVDLWEEFEASKGPKVFQHYLHPDGLHLGAAGNRKVFEAVQRTIRQHYPYLDPEAMDIHCPWHRDIASDATRIPIYPDD